MRRFLPLREKNGLSPGRWLLIWLLATGAAALALSFIRIGVNDSTSLDKKFFIVVKGKIPTDRGEYVVFRWAGQGGYYRPGALFTKIIEGVPGERVDVTPNGLVTVAGRAVGFAKPRASNGLKMDPIEPCVIPPGYVFVVGESADSLDSRYRLVGLVKRDSVYGTAYGII